MKALDRPVVLIVHGAWHKVEHYELLTERLIAQGFDVECPLLKTCEGQIPPVHTLDDDITQVRSIALHHMGLGRRVVALCHSYGGIVCTNALSDLGAHDARPNTESGYVSHIVYMCAFIPLENASLESALPDGLPSWLVFGDDGVIRVDQPEHFFYNDLPQEERARYAAMLTVHPIAAQVEATKARQTRAAWRSIPSTYLFCDNDKALLPAWQQNIVSRVEDEGIKVKKNRCFASHSPYLSMPEELVKVILEASKDSDESAS